MLIALKGSVAWAIDRMPLTSPCVSLGVLRECVSFVSETQQTNFSTLHKSAFDEELCVFVKGDELCLVCELLTPNS